MQYREKIIDSHVHCYPSAVAADPVGWGTARGEHHWVDLVTKGPQGWADVEDLLRQMDADGIERVVLQGWYWENPLTALEQNQWHADWVSRYPDRIWAMAAVHPGASDPVAVLEEARGWASGVGECLPQVQSSKGWKDPGWEAVLHWTTAVDWPLCLHITEPVGHCYPGRVATDLQETVEQLEKWPQQRWILAHWGGGLPFYALNKRVAKATARVWYDSAASPLLYDAKVWPLMLQAVGPKRLLFGSDFPLRLYPRDATQPGWKRLLAEVVSEIEEDADLRHLFFATAEEVFSRSHLRGDT
jgi:hypothetical protein